VTDAERRLDDQAATTPAELDEADLDQAAGGVTHHDMSFTHPVDKSSPTLQL
jgi:type VI protein secretion system component Hcp